MSCFSVSEANSPIVLEVLQTSSHFRDIKLQQELSLHHFPKLFLCTDLTLTLLFLLMCTS